MRGISISEVLMYIITVVIIVGLTFYFAFFLNVSASINMASESYLLFLNSLYLNRINYCIYLATKDPNYLFYFVRDMDISNMGGLEDYIKNCFSRVITNFNMLVGNYSVNSEEDLKRLSEYICGWDDNWFKDRIKKEYKDSIILIYQKREISTVPVFAYLNISSGKVGWILEPAFALFEQERISEESAKNIFGRLLETVPMIIFPPYIFYKIGSELYREYKERELIENLEKSTESFVSCTADKSYSILPTFAIQSLVTDSNRNLYVLSVMQFSKSKKLDEEAFIAKPDKSFTNVSVEELKGYCYVVPPTPV